MQSLAPKVTLQGIRQRKSGAPKELTYSIDQIASKVFSLVGKFVTESIRDWDTFNQRDKISTLQVITPIALKRIPDKHEVISLSVNATPDEINALMLLAQANLRLREAGHQVITATSTQPITQQQVTSTDSGSD